MKPNYKKMVSRPTILFSWTDFQALFIYCAVQDSHSKVKYVAFFALVIVKNMVLVSVN